ncbi:MAG: AMP-binding protein [Armatimonadota bacterium]
MNILCFGDSLTSCGGDEGRFSDILRERFPAHAFINKGVGGEAFPEARKRLRADVLTEKPDIVLVEFGANDWWRDERPYTAWAQDLDYILRRIRKAGARAVVVGVFGAYRNTAGELVTKEYGADERAFAYKELEEAIARKHACPYVPNMQERIVGDRRCWSDANHPNEYGNRSVADAIEPALAELLGTKPLPIRKPVLETTRDFWREAVALAPERLAVVDGDRRLTYGEANGIVETLAANIALVTGVQRPTVAVYLPNCLEYYLIYWATQRLGGVIVPLNTWLKEESLAGIFRMVQPDILFVRGPRDEFAVRAGQGMAVYATEDAVGLRPYADLLQPASPAPETPLTGGDLSIIMHTSGTTSTPKGAMMRHADLMFNVAAAINAHSFSPADIHLLVNPMFHCTALYSSLPTAAYQKAPVIIVPTTDPEVLMDVVQRERITTFLSIPSVFQKILMLPDLERYDASSLRVMAYAGSPMPFATIRELRRRFPEVALHNFFGLTETISMTHVLRNEDVETHPDSIGRLLPFVEAIVVDEEDKPMPPGEPGELLFAREEIIPGYFQQPARLQDALVELHGKVWFRTGDLAAVDEEGFFTVKGRKKDMIIVGGENVFAAEVEAVLLAHDKVREAAVKGIPATGVRSFLGELVKAYIVPADATLTELDLKKHCYERLPSYKVPATFAFLDALPRNPSGKVVKDELP